MKTAEETVKELLWLGFKQAQNVYRLYPDNKHTFISGVLINGVMHDTLTWVYCLSKSITFDWTDTYRKDFWIWFEWPEENFLGWVMFLGGCDPCIPKPTKKEF